MPQYNTWENEYKNSKLITKESEPQKFIQRFIKFLKTKEKVNIKDLKVLDLGCGTGRNCLYFAKLGAEVVGVELSPTALNIAVNRTNRSDLKITYIQGDIGEKYNFKDNYFDVVLDATTSNSLNERERKNYLEETARVLKRGGYFFVRALCVEGDKNAKKLLNISPGSEDGTYIMPGLKLTEKVFSRKEFVDIYSKKFKILKIIKETGYTRVNNQNYKRNYLIAYMIK